MNQSFVEWKAQQQSEGIERHEPTGGTLLTDVVETGITASLAHLEKQEVANQLTNAQAEHERARARAANVEAQTREASAHLQTERQQAEIRSARANATLTENAAIRDTLGLMREFQALQSAGINIELGYDDHGRPKIILEAQRGAMNTPANAEAESSASAPKPSGSLGSSKEMTKGKKKKKRNAGRKRKKN